MKNIYFGKFDDSFILYFDPINIDISKIARDIKSVYCNEIIFDNYEDKTLNNKKLDLNSFIEEIKDKIIIEFDLILDKNTHIQNIWWDDILIISKLDLMAEILNNITNFISIENLKYLEISLQSPNDYITFENDTADRQKINPSEFLDFIKNSDRYEDKVQKIY